jgi:hypothetical protein
VPITLVAKVRAWILAEFHPADHKIQMAIVVAIIAGISLLYARQVSRDRRMLQVDRADRSGLPPLYETGAAT